MQKFIQKDVKDALCRQLSGIVRLMLPQIAARLLASLPLWLPMISKVSFSAVTTILWLLGGCVLLVYPLRFRAAFRLRHMLGMSGVLLPGYGKRVLGGLLRMLRGGVWAVPLAGVGWLIYRYVFVLDASKYADALQKLGSLFFAGADASDQQMAGLILFLLLLCASILLFLFGWRRHLLYDYLLRDMADPVQTFARVRAVQKACAPALRKVMLGNLLTLLPALLLPAAAFCMHCGSLRDALMSLFLLISTGVALYPTAMWMTAMLFLLLFLPLIPFRKGCYAAVVNQYEQKR